MKSWKLEVGSWKLEVGSWKLEVGGWRLEVTPKAGSVCKAFENSLTLQNTLARNPKRIFH